MARDKRRASSGATHSTKSSCRSGPSQRTRSHRSSRGTTTTNPSPTPAAKLPRMLTNLLSDAAYADETPTKTRRGRSDTVVTSVEKALSERKRKSRSTERPLVGSANKNKKKPKTLKNPQQETKKKESVSIKKERKVKTTTPVDSGNSAPTVDTKGFQSAKPLQVGKSQLKKTWSARCARLIESDPSLLAMERDTCPFVFFPNRVAKDRAPRNLDHTVARVDRFVTQTLQPTRGFEFRPIPRKSPSPVDTGEKGLVEVLTQTTETPASTPARVSPEPCDKAVKLGSVPESVTGPCPPGMCNFHVGNLRGIEFGKDVVSDADAPFRACSYSSKVSVSTHSTMVDIVEEEMKEFTSNLLARRAILVTPTPLPPLPLVARRWYRDEVFFRGPVVSED